MTEINCNVPQTNPEKDGGRKQKSPARRRGSLLFIFSLHHPQVLPHEPPQADLPPKGILEEMANPDRGPASMKSTLMLPHVFSKLASTRNFKFS
jgi:hypothetical protein